MASAELRQGADGHRGLPEGQPGDDGRAALRKLPGFEGAYLLRRDLDGNGTVELTAHTFWESPAAIRAFAGNDVTVAIIEPQARAMLLDFDRTATHRSVAADARSSS